MIEAMEAVEAVEVIEAAEVRTITTEGFRVIQVLEFSFFFDVLKILILRAIYFYSFHYETPCSKAITCRLDDRQVQTPFPVYYIFFSNMTFYEDILEINRDRLDNIQN